MNREPIVYVVARAATNEGAPWTVWPVPESTALRVLASLDPQGVRTTQRRAQAEADRLNQEPAIPFEDIPDPEPPDEFDEHPDPAYERGA